MCGACRVKVLKKENGRNARLRQKGFYGSARNGVPLPVGGASPFRGTVKRIPFHMNFVTRQAIRELMRRDWDKRVKAGTDGAGSGMQWAMQIGEVSRILREAVLVWETAKVCPVQPASSRQLCSEHFSFCVDARVLAVIARHAEMRGGNVSWTVCDMVAGAAAKPTWGVGLLGNRE
jgi:hypothetical protein